MGRVEHTCDGAASGCSVVLATGVPLSRPPGRPPTTAAARRSRAGRGGCSRLRQPHPVSLLRQPHVRRPNQLLGVARGAARKLQRRPAKVQQAVNGRLQRAIDLGLRRWPPTGRSADQAPRCQSWQASLRVREYERRAAAWPRPHGVHSGTCAERSVVASSGDVLRLVEDRHVGGICRRSEQRHLGDTRRRVVSRQHRPKLHVPNKPRAVPHHQHGRHHSAQRHRCGPALAGALNDAVPHLLNAKIRPSQFRCIHGRIVNRLADSSL